MARRRDEPVRLTRIYTRTGDKGETSLGDGSRVSKLDPRIRAFGAVDEVNSQLGLVLADGALRAELRPVLERVQNELFDVGASLSVPWEREGRLRVDQAQIDALEADCDRFNAELPERFGCDTCPGGSSSNIGVSDFGGAHGDAQACCANRGTEASRHARHQCWTGGHIHEPAGWRTVPQT